MLSLRVSLPRSTGKPSPASGSTTDPFCRKEDWEAQPRALESPKSTKGKGSELVTGRSMPRSSPGWNLCPNQLLKGCSIEQFHGEWPGMQRELLEEGTKGKLTPGEAKAQISFCHHSHQGQGAPELLLEVPCPRAGLEHPCWNELLFQGPGHSQGHRDSP